MKAILTAGLALVLIAGFFAPARADGFMRRLINGGAEIKGSGDMVTQVRDVPEFNKIRSTGAFDVHITVGNTQRVTITFDDNLIDLAKTEVKGKTLRLYCDESYSSRKGCKIEITVPELQSVDASGSGDFIIENLKGDSFEYDISGSGDATISGEVGELNVTVTGSGDVDIDGHATDVDVVVSGSGDVDAHRLIAENATVRVSGSGDVRVHATGDFNGRVSGSGDIAYYGNPAHVSKRVSGSGDISAR